MKTLIKIVTYRRCTLNNVTTVVALAAHQSEPLACIFVFANFSLEALLLLGWFFARLLLGQTFLQNNHKNLLHIYTSNLCNRKKFVMVCHVGWMLQWKCKSLLIRKPLISFGDRCNYLYYIWRPFLTFQVKLKTVVFYDWFISFCLRLFSKFSRVQPSTHWF